MSEASRKMQLRADLISILNKYRDTIHINNLELKKDIEIIKNYPDKDIVAKTLFKELTTAKDGYANVCAILILEGIDENLFEKHSIDFLKNKNIPDEKKFFIISLLKQKGIYFSYDNIKEYIKHPELVAQKGVKDFLLNATQDPEVQIDLLDFYTNISHSEKVYLLNNLIEEFENDDLANVLTLIVQLDIKEDELGPALEGLLKTKSPYSKIGLEYILKNYKNLLNSKKIRLIEKTIKELDIFYKDFKNTAIIQYSKITSSYISFCDGCADFSLTLTRKKDENSCDVVLYTININKGIISCMGFGNITQENEQSIIKRLFCDSMPVNIPPNELKAILNHYSKKTLDNNLSVPYEHVVWKNLLNDVADNIFDISEHINSKLKTINLTASKAKKFMSSKMLETWYYSFRQNEKVDKLISYLEENHIIELEKINEIVSKYIDENFLTDKDFLVELENKLLIQSYVAYLAELNTSSSCAYSFCFKNPYLKLLITSIIDKSLYYYFSTRALEMDEDKENVFAKKFKTNFTKDELEMIMSQLEEKWT